MYNPCKSAVKRRQRRQRKPFFSRSFSRLENSQFCLLSFVNLTMCVCVRVYFNVYVCVACAHKYRCSLISYSQTPFPGTNFNSIIHSLTLFRNQLLCKHNRVRISRVHVLFHFSAFLTRLNLRPTLEYCACTCTKSEWKTDRKSVWHGWSVVWEKRENEKMNAKKNKLPATTAAAPPTITENRYLDFYENGQEYMYVYRISPEYVEFDASKLDKQIREITTSASWCP